MVIVEPSADNTNRSGDTGWLTRDEPILTKKELSAWYLYAFASEVFAVVSLSTFIPLILERLASQQGVITSDHTTPCTNSTELVASEEVRCVVKIFGQWVDTASFSLYTFATSVLIQAITAISIGAAADHGVMRKKLLLSFAFVGSIASMLFIFIKPILFLVGAFFAIIGNVCFGASIVCFNGFLPVLVRNHPDVRRIVDDLKMQLQQSKNLGEENEVNPNEVLEGDNDSRNNNIDERQGLLNNVSNESDTNLLSEELSITRDKLSTKISANGFASGYFGGIILLAMCSLIAYLMKGSIFSLQIGVFLSGLWWFLFSLFVAKWLEPRPGPALESPDGSELKWIDYIIYSWKRLWITVLHARQLKLIFQFLVAWFLLSDGYTTISSVALLFAQTTLQIQPTGVLIIALITPIAALVGTIVWPKLQLLLNISAKQTILLLLILLSVIPSYGCLGFVLPIGGLKSAGELYVLAVWYGFLLGPIQSYCRTLFAELVPRGRETEFFALYAVTDKGSSWIGPMLVAMITDITHEIRYGFFILLILLLLPIPIIQRLKQ